MLTVLDSSLIEALEKHVNGIWIQCIKPQHDNIVRPHWNLEIFVVARGWWKGKKVWYANWHVGLDWNDDIFRYMHTRLILWRRKCNIENGAKNQIFQLKEKRKMHSKPKRSFIVGKHVWLSTMRKSHLIYQCKRWINSVMGYLSSAGVSVKQILKFCDWNLIATHSIPNDISSFIW